jgi:hypothetical protein
MNLVKGNCVTTRRELPVYYCEEDHEFYLELHDHRTARKLDNQYVYWNDAPFFIGDLVETACKEFQTETGVEVYMLGRMGRHVCVKNTIENRLRYDELREIALRWELWVIDYFNSWRPEGAE